MRLDKIVGLIFFLSVTSAVQAAEIPASDGIDALYAEITRTVEGVDFDAMEATYHEDAVVVTLKSSVAIGPTIERWRANALEAQARGVEATVAFKISSRVLGESTAFDTGIFRYSITSKYGEDSVSYINYEGLLIKRHDQWLWLMERQLEKVTEVEWRAIK